MFVLIKWYFRPVVKVFEARSIFMVYVQFVLAATWFIGIWIVWYCNLRIQAVYLDVYKILFVESNMHMRGKSRFSVFKAEVFCRLFEESARQMLKGNLGIFRRLTAYEEERAVNGIYDEQMVVRESDTSLGGDSLCVLKSSSLAVLGGMAVIRSAVRQMIYRSLGISENTPVL
jgi:hypothetical protein